MKSKIINKILVGVMVIVSLILLIYRISIGNYRRITTDCAIFFVLLIPSIVSNFIELNDRDKLIIYVFIFIADFLGCVVNLYRYITWFDIFSHFSSGIFFFLVGIKLLDVFNYKGNNILFSIIFAIGIVFTSACLWEIFEFLMDRIFSLNLQHYIDTGVFDTMEDIISCTCGGILSSVIYKIKKSK